MLLEKAYFSFRCGLFLAKAESSFGRHVVRKSQNLSEELEKIRLFKVPHNVKFPGAVILCLKKSLTKPV